MKLTRLCRNLKCGDKFTVRFENKSTVVKVSVVQETRNFHSRKRIWEIHANYPWWFPGPVIAYSTDKMIIFRDKK